jgi:ribonuclease R
MLPEILSNGVCSLKPNEDKLCFLFVVTLNKEGDILSKWFGKTIIHSDRRFSYEEAQDIIEGNSGDYEAEILIQTKLLKNKK